MNQFSIKGRTIGKNDPAYIIAEVGSNFDGSLERAKMLAERAKGAGADAYKIQNFKAEDIVSSTGFKNLHVGFQATWQKPVVDVYKAAEFPREWLKELAAHCASIGIDFFSSPYDVPAVDALEEVNIPAYKIGSGEIDNTDFLMYVAKTGKPVLLGVGAATMDEISHAVQTLRKGGAKDICLLQCVTNYPSSVADANIRAMTTLAETFDVIVGYSDHTTGIEGGGDDPLQGITIPLASVALGAKVIEKHFTDDTKRSGPDHPFAMDVPTFTRMVQGIRAVEQALGTGKKEVTSGEKQTVVIQRRGAYAKRAILKGEKLSKDLIVLHRPAIGIRPIDLEKHYGKKAGRDIAKGEPLYEDAFI